MKNAIFIFSLLLFVAACSKQEATPGTVDNAPVAKPQIVDEHTDTLVEPEIDADEEKQQVVVEDKAAPAATAETAETAVPPKLYHYPLWCAPCRRRGWPIGLAQRSWAPSRTWLPNETAAGGR